MRWLLLLTASAAFSAPKPEQFPVVNGKFLEVYASHPLTGGGKIERVFVMVHGVLRDAPVYFRSATQATRDSGRQATTLVLAPHFRCTRDEAAANELVFPCGQWSGGGQATNAPTTTFAALDALLLAVTNKERFPHLKEVVVAGHSAGGQFVQRYAAANRVEAKLTVPMRYMVANPSSYLYLEPWRPAPVPATCKGVNNYKYGLDALTGYAAETGADAIRAQYPKRNVTYLLGELDTTPEHDMDTSCQAMAQGANRFVRGEAYFERLKQQTAASHQLLRVPACGHSGQCMYRSPVARRAVFGE